MRVIFVCTGNTCRSPMAEIMLRHMLNDESIIVESRGVMCKENMPMALNAKVVMAERGYEREHLSKALTIEDIKDSEMIITMTRSHKEYIKALYGEHDNVYTMDEIAGYGDIDDPYGGDIEVYRACAKEIEQSLGKVAKEILSRVKR